MREFHGIPRRIRPVSPGSYEIQEIRRKVDPEVDHSDPIRDLLFAVSATAFVFLVAILLLIGVFHVR